MSLRQWDVVKIPRGMVASRCVEATYADRMVVAAAVERAHRRRCVLMVNVACNRRCVSRRVRGKFAATMDAGGRVGHVQNRRYVQSLAYVQSAFVFLNARGAYVATMAVADYAGDVRTG